MTQDVEVTGDSGDSGDDEVWTPAPMGTSVPSTDDVFLLHKRPQAETFEQYLEAMLNHVGLKYRLRGLGCPMNDLNRRFSGLSRKFGVSPIDVVKIHAGQGLLHVQSHRNNLIVFLTSDWDTLLTADIDTALERTDAVCDQTLKDIGKHIPDKPAKKQSATKRSTFW